MRRFNDLFKEKHSKAIQVNEAKVLTSFEQVYNVLLEKYNINSYEDLSEKYQIIFAGELNNYWDEENGLTEKGQNFLKQKSAILNENATLLQKRNFLKNKANIIIKETFRQVGMRTKFYDIIDEMYNTIGATSLKQVLDPATISNILKESLTEASEEFIDGINAELAEACKSTMKKEMEEPKKVKGKKLLLDSKKFKKLKK